MGRESSRRPTLQKSEGGVSGRSVSPRGRMEADKPAQRCATDGLEADYDASLEPEITLIIVAVCERIAESRQDVIGFRRADGEHFIDRDIQAPTNDEIKRVVGGRINATAAHIANIYVCVGM